MQLQRFAYLSISLAFVGLILVVGKNLLIPIVLAIFLWFIVREVRLLLRRIKFVREKMPLWAENLLASIFLFSFFGLMIVMVGSNISILSQKIPLYEKNINEVIHYLNQRFNMNLFEQLKTYSGNVNISGFLKFILNTVSSLFGNVFIILIYVLFIFLEESGFSHKLKAISSNSAKMESTMDVLNKIDHSIGQYLLLKTFVSVLTGILSFTILAIFKVDAAFFWAFLIFILNYIPTIGSLTATFLPSFFAILQFGEVGIAIWILVSLSTIQLIIDNILEPKIMGNSLNLSPLAVLIALSLWGAIWGVTGMILSIPITVIGMILLSEFPKTRPIAILLSAKGTLIMK